MEGTAHLPVTAHLTSRKRLHVERRRDGLQWVVSVAKRRHRGACPLRHWRVGKVPDDLRDGVDRVGVGVLDGHRDGPARLEVEGPDWSQDPRGVGCLHVSPERVGKAAVCLLGLVGYCRRP